MAKQTKGLDKAIGILLVVGIPIVLIGKLLDEVGVVISVLIGTAVIVAFIWRRRSRREKRLEYLRGKYGDEATVQRILQRNFWEGQTSAQLLDALGSPASIDKKLLKTKTREVWKYNHRGANRYGLRITLDENLVSGWDQKS
jgi:hypothetical protein